MMYPRLYMLSTLGVRKHYHQDYELHEHRTDFAGRNGIGKSILADLIQLIFVQDRNIIRFGTDGLNKEGRSIETIPYLHQQAYSYFTIETDHNLFIIIGVCIPTDSKTPLRPFVITKHADIDRARIQELAFGKEQIVKSRHLLVENHVVPISELAVHIRSKLGLALTLMKMRDYLAFLNRLKLLSINLTNESNLKSFARVIQSFSRAKDFNPTDPKNLKNFLFDEVGEQFSREFKQHQNTLAEQLTKYKDLNEINEKISSNQKKLEVLKGLEIDWRQAELVWRQANSERQKKEVERQTIFLTKLIAELEGNKNEVKQLEKKVYRLEQRLIPTSEKLVQQAEDYHKLLSGCNDILIIHSQHDKDEQQLAALSLPDLSQFASKIAEEPDELTINSLCKKVKWLIPILNEFGTLEAIESRVTNQEKILQDWLNDVDQSIERISLALKIITQDKEDSLFAAVLKRGLPLTPNQETVLFHLLDNGWNTTKGLEKGAKYVSDLAALDTTSIEDELQSHDAFWFKAGYLHERVGRRSDPQLLGDTDAIKTAKTNAKERLEDRLKSFELTKLAIVNARNGKPFDANRLPAMIDERFTNRHQLDQIEITLKRAQNISNLLENIKLAKKKLNDDLQSRLSNYPVIVSIIDLPQLTRKWNIIHNIRKNRNKQLLASFINVSSKSAALKEALPKKEVDYIQHKSELEISRAELNSITEQYKEFFKIIDRDYPDLSKDIFDFSLDFETVENNFTKARKAYQDKYTLLAYPYRISESPEYNLQIDEQVKEDTFSFKVLEVNLLSGVGLLEKVDVYLTTLNNHRMDCRRIIYDEIKSLFAKTINKYETYHDAVRNLNTFFLSRKVSNRFYFHVHFSQAKLSDGRPMIDWVNTLNKEKDAVFESHELELGKSVSQFIEEFYQQIAKESLTKSVHELLDPKSYFSLSIRLLDDAKNEVPGSTGEAYTSIILLGIGRLSIMSKNDDGIKFVLLEETASIDKENFNLVMSIAADFGYQILTMTPEPYGVGASSEWYLHQLIPGNEDPNINHPNTASYFRKVGHPSVLQNQ